MRLNRASHAIEPATDSRYPVGRFVAPDPIRIEDREYAVSTLAEMPSRLRNAVRGLDDEQLDTPYREGGWTVREIVHHLADGHSFSVLCARMALAQDWPNAMPVDGDAWATQRDYAAPVEWSLQLIEALHARWGMLLRSLSDEQWQRGYLYSRLGRLTIEKATLVYAWHSRHHVAQITTLRTKENW